MKYSIKQQIAGIFIAVMAGTIILAWFVNNTFLEKYYISNKTHSIYSAYESLDDAVSGGSVATDEFDLELRGLCDMYNIKIVYEFCLHIPPCSVSYFTNYLCHSSCL